MKNMISWRDFPSFVAEMSRTPSSCSAMVSKDTRPMGYDPCKMAIQSKNLSYADARLESQPTGLYKASDRRQQLYELSKMGISLVSPEAN